MVALYRSGRRGDALLAFQDVSAILREELGLDPGDRLRAAHQLVLSAAAPAAKDRWVVWQRPADVSDFVGRQRLIRRIGELVASGARIVTLSGPPGIGKTALAVHAAHELATRFPDGQLFLDLRGYSAGGAVDARGCAGQVPAGAWHPAGLDLNRGRRAKQLVPVHGGRPANPCRA
jgi:hypothetical protein